MLLMLLTFGCDIGTEYTGDEKGTVTGEWDFERTEDFVRRAYSSNWLEIELGELAVKQAQKEVVREFAENMMIDHSNSNEQLMEIVAQNDYNLAESLLEDDRKKLNKLHEEVGEDNFDEEYLDIVKEQHKHFIKKLKAADDEITDLDLKRWINVTLEKVEGYLHKAQELDEFIGN